jgi:hypothetical protein
MNDKIVFVLDAFTAFRGLKSNLVQSNKSSDVSPKGLDLKLSCHSNRIYQICQRSKLHGYLTLHGGWTPS